MRRTRVCACLLTAFLPATSPVLGDGGFFPLVIEGEAADLAQTRQEALLAIYDLPQVPDTCAGAAVLPFFDASDYGTLAQATPGGVTDCGGSPEHADVWYSYTPLGDGLVTFTLGSSSQEISALDFTLSVHSDCPGDDGVVFACGSDVATDSNAWLEATLTVIAGGTYLVRVAGPSDADYVLTAAYEGLPAADACADAPRIAPGVGYADSTFDATNDASVGCGDTLGSPDVWYSYVPERDGEVTIGLLEITTNGEPAGMALSVHTACPGSDSNLLACNDDFERVGNRADAALSVTAGTTYFIRIASPIPRVGDSFNVWVDVLDDGGNVPDATPAGVPHVTYVLGSDYDGDPSEFAWVIPVPNTPFDVVAHDTGELFDALDDWTRPTFEITGGFPTGGGCGCGGPPSLSLGESGLGGVEVEARGQAGIFEWAALTSTGSNALLTWLNANGFSVSAGAGDVLADYIQRGMHFLAVRVSRPEDMERNDSGEKEIPPIQFTCQTSERFYPMAISQVSAAAETEVLIYVVADHRMEAANVPNAVIDRDAVAYDPGSESQTNYESLFTQAVAGLGGVALITEYAAPDHVSWPEAPVEVSGLDFLTRIRTVIAREMMEVDFEFQDAVHDEEVSNRFYLGAVSDTTTAAVAGPPLAALLAFAFLRTAVRHRHRRRSPDSLRRK